MTDNEVKKALECCAKAKTNTDCRKLKCPFFDDAIDMCGTLNSEQVLFANALDLINRLEAENERLEQNLKEAHIDIKEHLAENERLTIRLRKAEHQLDDLCKMHNIIKAEAYKEFAERLKEEFPKEFDEGLCYTLCVGIDNLLNELVGGNNV